MKKSIYFYLVLIILAFLNAIIPIISDDKYNFIIGNFLGWMYCVFLLIYIISNKRYTSKIEFFCSADQENEIPLLCETYLNCKYCPKGILYIKIDKTNKNWYSSKSC